MEQLQLSLLGTYTAFWGEKPVTNFSSDKVRALTAYLALEGKRPLRRETLATLLWADWPDKIARRNLRQNLHRLKQLLDILDPGLSGRLLTISRQTIQINCDVLWLDVAEFQAAVTAVTDHSHPQLHTCQTCLDGLTRAARLMAGDLLAGFTLPDAPLFDEWLTVQRERLHYQRLQLLYTLADIHRQRQEYDLAYTYAAQQTALEPWREEAHRQMMVLLVQQGRRREALSQYATCCRILEEELGAEPSAETETLYNQIINETLPIPTKAALPILHHFPTYFTPFVGRQAECDQIQQQLQKPDCRLLTLIAPGGIGKTRLAITAAEQVATSAGSYPDGLFFAPLTAAQERNELLTSLAQAVGLTLKSMSDLETDLLAFLAGRRMLLILDNFEQLNAESDLLTALLTAVPGLQLLVTSRQPLRLQAEWRLQLGGLPFPPTESDPDWLDYPAVALFIQTARRLHPDFKPDKEQAAISHICRLVDGMPLALEMAAAWTSFLTCAQIAEQIAANLDLLVANARDASVRHASIRVLFAQSWALLTEKEQTTLAQLALFQGGFNLEAALFVTGTNIMTIISLADKALIRPDHAGRYEMHLLLRQFGLEKLAVLSQAEGNLAANGRHRHATYFLQQIAVHETDFHTARAPAVRQAMQPDLDNIRQAWQWATSQDDTAALSTTQKGIGRFFSLLGLHGEAAALMAETAAQLAEQPGEEATAALLRYREARLRLELSQYQAAAALLAEVCTLWQTAGAAAGSTVDRAYAQADWGIADWRMGSFESAHLKLETALAIAEPTANKGCIAYILHHLGNVAFFRENAAVALSKIKQSVPLYQEHGDLRRLAGVMTDLGSAYKLSQQDHAQANACYTESLALYRQLGDRLGLTFPLSNQAYLALHNQQYDLAQQLFQEVTDIGKQLGAKAEMAVGLHHLGLIALVGKDDIGTATDYFKESLRLAYAIQHRYLIGDILIGLAAVATRQGKFTQAGRLAGIVCRLRLQIGEEGLEDELYAEVTIAARAALDKTAFAALWAEGEGMNLAEAVACGLESFS